MMSKKSFQMMCILTLSLYASLNVASAADNDEPEIDVEQQEIVSGWGSRRSSQHRSRAVETDKKGLELFKKFHVYFDKPEFQPRGQVEKDQVLLNDFNTKYRDVDWFCQTVRRDKGFQIEKARGNFYPTEKPKNFAFHSKFLYTTDDELAHIDLFDIYYIESKNKEDYRYFLSLQRGKGHTDQQHGLGPIAKGDVILVKPIPLQFENDTPQVLIAKTYYTVDFDRSQEPVSNRTQVKALMYCRLVSGM